MLYKFEFAPTLPAAYSRTKPDQENSHARTKPHRRLARRRIRHFKASRHAAAAEGRKNACGAAAATNWEVRFGK